MRPGRPPFAVARGPRARLAVAACAALLVPGVAAAATQAPGTVEPAAADRRLDAGAPANGRAAQSVMMAAAAAGTRIVVAGERGTIVHSDDCGMHWTQARVPVGVTLTALAFADAQNGWAVGHGGVVLTTRDAGATWTRQLDGRTIAQLALAAARQAQATGRPDARRALADAERLVADGPDKPLFAVHFRTPRSGIVVGAFGLALATDDGGASWQWIADRIPNPKGLHLYGLWVRDAQVYVVGEQGLVARSGDGAQRFEALASPYAGSYFGLAEITPGAAPELMVHGLRGRAYRLSTASQAFEPVDLPTQASVLGVLARKDGPLLLFDADGQVSELVAGERRARPAASSPVGPVLGAVPACGRSVVLAGLRGIAVVDAAGPALAAAKGVAR